MKECLTSVGYPLWPLFNDCVCIVHNSIVFLVLHWFINRTALSGSAWVLKHTEEWDTPACPKWGWTWTGVPGWSLDIRPALLSQPQCLLCMALTHVYSIQWSLLGNFKILNYILKLHSLLVVHREYGKEESLKHFVRVLGRENLVPLLVFLAFSLLCGRILFSLSSGFWIFLKKILPNWTLLLLSHGRPVLLVLHCILTWKTQFLKALIWISPGCQTGAAYSNTDKKDNYMLKTHLCQTIAFWDGIHEMNLHDFSLTEYTYNNQMILKWTCI